MCTLPHIFLILRQKESASKTRLLHVHMNVGYNNNNNNDDNSNITNIITEIFIGEKKIEKNYVHSS